MSAKPGLTAIIAISIIVFSISLLSTPAFSQYGANPQKPVYKNGKFIFYGNRRTISVNKKSANSQPRYEMNRNENFPSALSNTTTPLAVNGVIQLTITTQDPDCSNQHGTIIVQATNGTPPYKFTLTDPYGFPTTQGNGNFPFALTGTNIITVTDAAGNVSTSSATLTSKYPGPMTATFVDKNPTTCASNDGSITLNASGGTPPYMYSLDGKNWQTSNVIANLYPGWYNTFVKDANGCTLYVFGQPLIRSSCDELGLSYADVVCGPKGSINMVNEGPDKPYEFSLDGINYQAGTDFSNLVPGYYPIYIKGKSGEVRIYAVVLRELCRLLIVDIVVDAACQQNDGIITIDASNGTAPYAYTIDGINYQSSNVFPGLAPGNYTITVKDGAGQTESLTATVYDRCPQVTAISTAETCAKNDGTITATGTKGTTPYQFSIDGVNFQTGNIFTGLTKGNYTITIKDAMDFTSSAIIEVKYGCVQVGTSVVNAGCNNATGTITATATGGTAPYTYSIDGVNFQYSNNFTAVAPGSYTVTVKDATGATSTGAAVITTVSGPVLVSINALPASCNLNDGSVTINATNGTAPLQYSIDGTGYQTNNMFTALPSNSYTIYVKDANGCTVTQCCAVVTIKCLSVSALATDASCGKTNGSINVTALNGEPPYQFSIDGTNFQSLNNFNNLGPGNYTVTVKDAENSTRIVTAKVNERCLAVFVTATGEACDKRNGSVIVTASLGTAPYEYSIDNLNFQKTNLFAGLTAGSYNITARDINGVTGSSSVIIDKIAGPQLNKLNSSPATCLNNDGTVEIIAVGGTSPLSYTIDAGTFLNNNTFLHLASGSHVATVRDANNCMASQPAVVSFTDNLLLEAGADKTICEGATLQLSIISNGTDFSWSPGTLSSTTAKDPTAFPVISTKYYVTARTGICSKKDSVMVFVNAAPVATAAKDTSICFGQSVMMNGGGGIKYQWSPSDYLSDPGSVNPTVQKPRNSITYSLVVEGANHCKSLNDARVSVTVIPTAALFAGHDTSISISEPLPLNAMDINGSGFTQYTWSPSYGLSNSFIKNPVAMPDHDIIYIVTAMTANGCEASDAIAIKVFRTADIFVPTAFTPDGNGRNDILKAIPVGIREFKYFIVYDRWGAEVFKTTNPANGWDGKRKGVDLQTSTFVWITEGTDFKGNMIRRKGTVTLIR